jgi:hypothetical protein
MACVLLVSGCASMSGGETQAMRVTATEASGEEVPGASCRLTNDKGAWNVRTPGEVQVRRSNNAITVSCDKKPLATGHASVPSMTRDAMYGNLLFGGLIGIAIDHSSGAGYEYSPHVNVVMGTFTTVVASPPDAGGKRVQHDGRGNLPEASGFADYREVTAVPSPRARSAYQAFLGRKFPRAFVLNEHGTWQITSGGSDAVPRALRLCAERHQVCRLYAYDDVVVWRAEDSVAIASAAPAPKPAAAQKPAPRRAPAPAESTVITTSANKIPADHIFVAPTDTGFAKLSDPYALPFVDAGARERYQQRYLILRAPKAFAIGARGQWQYLANDPRSMKTILERCEASNKGTCWLYAVDDRVVWSEDSEKRISIDKLQLRPDSKTQVGVEP